MCLNLSLSGMAGKFQEREAVTQASALDVHGHIFFLNKLN